MHHVDVEDTVWIAQKAVNLLVDEDEGMEDDRDHDHEEDFAEEGDVEADDVSSKVDPKDEVKEGFGKGVLHPRELVHCGEQSAIAGGSRLDKSKLGAGLLDHSPLGNLLRSFGS